MVQIDIEYVQKVLDNAGELITEVVWQALKEMENDSKLPAKNALNIALCEWDINLP